LSYGNRGFDAFGSGISDTEGTPASGHRFILLPREVRLEALTLDFGRVRRDGPLRIRRVAEADALTEERVDERLRHRIARGPTGDLLRISEGIHVSVVIGRVGEPGIFGRARIHRRNEGILRERAMVQTHASRGQTNALRAREDGDRLAEAFVEKVQAVDFVCLMIHCATPQTLG
jgi:hypothetical protein